MLSMNDHVVFQTDKVVVVKQIVFDHKPMLTCEAQCVELKFLFGFVAFVVVVFLGRFLRVFVKREEGYYDS